VSLSWTIFSTMSRSLHTSGSWKKHRVPGSLVTYPNASSRTIFAPLHRRGNAPQQQASLAGMDAAAGYNRQRSAVGSVTHAGMTTSQDD